MSLLHTAHLKVREDVIEPFRARLERHAAISLEREDGCLRFDFFQERDDPTLFLLIEIYADDAALEVHRKSSHYLAFREDVRDWVMDRKWWFWNPGRRNPQDGLP
ncbi:putative quinol monooxygenase [Microvirga sp. G4-2]|uniref:putative quinol monooxygenase n=1 Tax=Microvirga sp. G4-2 TaxID=3434467 RepID=UPI004044A9B2